MASNEKFWMYDVTQLFRSFELMPSPEDSLSAKLNTITRLALIMCIVIAAYKPVLAFSTLILVMVVTMSVYSGAVADPTIEGFEGGNDGCGSNPQLHEFMREYKSQYKSLSSSARGYPYLNEVGFPSTQKRFCNDDVPLEYGSGHVSPNQRLVGGPNPKTMVPPIIAAPSHDLDSWRNNDFAGHSQINKETNFDADTSGYSILPTKCEDCMYVPCQCKVLQRNQHPRGMVKGMVKGMMNSGGEEAGHAINGYIVEGFHEDVNDHMDGGGRIGRRSGPDIDRERRRQIIRNLINELGYNEPKNHKPYIKPYIRQYVRNAFLDRRLGDLSDGDLSDVEVDKIIEEIANRPAMTSENIRRDNIITQTLQPGVFQKSHIGEPIQSNIGISYTQEWGPTEVQETNDMIKYTMHDPKNTIITPQTKKEVIDQDHSNIYDPRFTGYGTSYRAYTDQLTGRPMFFYDDVDAITMPNFVTRSNVDMFPWANTYGPDKMKSSSEGDEYRQMANNAFINSTNTFRTELQERHMRKRNAELWQHRVAPIY